MAKLRINGDSSGYVDLEAPNAASSSTLDLDQVPQKNAANVFTTAQTIQNDNSYYAANIAESSHAAIALRVTPTRSGYTKGISLGAIGKNGALSTGIQAYDTSDNSSNTLELNPHGGAVTAPNQPSFLAISSGGTMSAGVQAFQNAAAYGAHTFTNIAHNIGSHYNSSNSRFTAPVTGLYQFYGSMATDSGQSAKAYLSFEFYINGARHRDGWDNHAVGYQKTSTVKTAYLNAGDYVYPGYESAQIFTLLGGSLTAQYVHFGGHLVG